MTEQAKFSQEANRLESKKETSNDGTEKKYSQQTNRIILKY